MKEIDDHKKADLEKVCCDNLTCGERGDFARCYLDIYRNCPHYKAKEKYNARDKLNPL